MSERREIKKSAPGRPLPIFVMKRGFVSGSVGCEQDSQSVVAEVTEAVGEGPGLLDEEKSEMGTGEKV